MKKEAAEDFFIDLYQGKHHFPGKIKPFGTGWEINHHGEMSTFDSDKLTQLVLLAHEKCVRATVMNSGPNMIKIVIHQRVRSGSMFERHPTIEQALT